MVKNEYYKGGKQIGVATLHAAADYYDGLYTALKIMGSFYIFSFNEIGTGLSEETSETVEHKYGE